MGTSTLIPSMYVMKSMTAMVITKVKVLGNWFVLMKTEATPPPPGKSEFTNAGMNP